MLIAARLGDVTWMVAQRNITGLDPSLETTSRRRSQQGKTNKCIQGGAKRIEENFSEGNVGLSSAADNQVQ